MPLAHVYIGPGRSAQKKTELIQKVTSAIEDTLGPLKQPVWVVLHEVPLTDWGAGGEPIRLPQA